MTCNEDCLNCVLERCILEEKEERHSEVKEQYASVYYLKNRDKILEHKAEYYKRNREAIRKRRAEIYRRKKEGSNVNNRGKN